MAALEDITAESKLANDFSCAELSHRQVELNIHESDLLWQSIFQLHYDSYVDINSFNGALIFPPSRKPFSIGKNAIVFRESMPFTTHWKRRPTTITLTGLHEHFIDYVISATDKAHIVCISVRTIQRRLQDFALSISSFYPCVTGISERQ